MSHSKESNQVPEVAIVGMSCRFPGAGNADIFWQNLKDGVESVSFFSDDELAAEGIHPNLLQNPNYIKASPILENIELFDAAFWNALGKLWKTPVMILKDMRDELASMAAQV
jgi:myxalamid-type polyketide synthase MxaB